MRRTWQRCETAADRDRTGAAAGDLSTGRRPGLDCGPNFLGATDIVAATTITGDAVCRSTNVDYRMDTTAARAFLSQFVTVP